MQYFRTKTHCVGVISKNGTNSFCEAYAKKIDPIYAKYLHIPEHDFTYRSMVEQVSQPDAPVLILLRDSVDRFISAVSMNGCAISPDEVIEDLLSGGEWSRHPLYFRQSDFVDDAKKHGQPVTLFMFPNQIKQFCTVAELDYPLPKRNACQGKKVTLTAVQEEAVRTYYAKDDALIDTILS